MMPLNRLLALYTALNHRGIILKAKTITELY